MQLTLYNMMTWHLLFQKLEIESLEAKLEKSRLENERVEADMGKIISEFEEQEDQLR